MITSLMSNATAGIQNGFDMLNRASGDIARVGTTRDADAKDIAESLVQLKLGKQQVVASAQMVKTADQLLGYLIDEKA